VPEVVQDLAAEQAELSALLADRPPSDWSLETRCEGWSVVDVVLHLAQTNEYAVASVTGALANPITGFSGPTTGTTTVDERVEAMVASERGTPSSEVRRRWQASARELDRVLVNADPHRRVPWVVGLLSVQTLAATRLAETWVHAGDVADPLGLQPRPTDRLFHVARLAWRTLPYAFERAGRQLSGPVAMHLRSPAGEPWVLRPDAAESTTIRGDALELCLVAARRLDPAATQLEGDGPDTAAVLDLIRTYA
jgi:uncharacterized protein (TIGR03084 family)